MSVAQAVMEIPAAHQLNVFGQFDCNIKKIDVIIKLKYRQVLRDFT